jgi:hypothetical protein
VFLPCVASHCSGVTEPSHVALTAHALQALHVCKNRSLKKGTFTREADFFTSLPRLALL